MTAEPRRRGLPALLGWLDRLWVGLPRWLAVTSLYVLLVGAWLYAAPIADLADTVIGPPIVQESLRAFVIVQVARAFTRRWNEFLPSQRWLWYALGLGIDLNLARGHFSGTPLTLSFLLLHLGMVGLTWRLMNTPVREVALTREVRHLNDELNRRQLAHAAELAECRRAHALEMARVATLTEDLLDENDLLDARCAELQHQLEIRELQLQHKEHP